jgi:rRNA-processing protein FCF1
VKRPAEPPQAQNDSAGERCRSGDTAGDADECLLERADRLHAFSR